MNNVKPVILAGGLGSRFRPYTYVVPKPLLPIGERPIIQLQLHWLKSFGFQEVAIALGWRGDLIKSFLGDGSRFGMQIHYVQEEQRLGTAGPLSLLKDWAGKDSLLSINGDLVTKLNLDKLHFFHFANKSGISIATREYEMKLPFGVVHSELGKFKEITEKPTYRYQVSAGIYLIDPSVLHSLDGTHCDMTTLIQVWKERVHVFEFREPWIAIEELGDFNNKINGEWIEWADGLEHRAMQLGAMK